MDRSKFAFELKRNLVIPALDERPKGYHILRHPIPAEFWSDMRKASLIPDDAPTPQGD